METLIKNIVDLNCAKVFSEESRNSFYQEFRDRVQNQLHCTISNSEFAELLIFSQDVYEYIRKEDPMVTENNLIYPRLNIVEAMLKQGYQLPTFLNVHFSDLRHRRRAQTC